MDAECRLLRGNICSCIVFVVWSLFLLLSSLSHLLSKQGTALGFHVYSLLTFFKPIFTVSIPEFLLNSTSEALYQRGDAAKRRSFVAFGETAIGSISSRV